MLSRQEIEESVLNRDSYRCRACGLGGELFKGVLECHHLVPSSITLDTGVTLCSNCVKLLKEAQQGSGVANVSLDELSSYSDRERYCLINIKKFAKYSKDILERSDK